MSLLAFDTSTETLSVALACGGALYTHAEAGGPNASRALIPAVQRLLGQAGLALADLRAIAFGAGPGSFTGLRSACAVAQGLGFGAGVPLLPIDTLLAVSEAARGHNTAPRRVLALLDARMDQVYAAPYAFDGTRWRALGDWRVCAPEALALPDDTDTDTATDTHVSPWRLAGNVRALYGARLPAALAALPCDDALPSADALLRLAPALLAAGAAVAPEHAAPRYVRDKVAFTSAERAAQRAAASGAPTATAP